MPLPYTPLPPQYSVAQLANGRFYPLSTFDDEPDKTPSLHTLHWEYQRIPFARGPMRTEGVVSFAQRRQAIQYCWYKHEEHDLLWQWEKHACEDEYYPERNAWYRVEIEQLAQASIRFHFFSPDHIASYRVGDTMYAAIWLDMSGHSRHMLGKAPSIDDALVALYELVVAQLPPAHTPASGDGQLKPEEVAR